MKYKLSDKVTVRMEDAPKCDGAITHNQHGTIVGLPMWEGDGYEVGFGAVKYARRYHKDELRAGAVK